MSVCFVICLLLFYNLCFAGLNPNEYGIIRNWRSGEVSNEPLRGGLHFIGPFSVFLRYPATRVTMNFGEHSFPSYGQQVVPAIQTRTGADPNDPDSGGQPISITCAYQYKVDPRQLKKVYENLGTFDRAIQRWQLIASTSISNTAQQFIPQDFWENRGKVAETMLQAVNTTLWEQTFIQAVKFQILRVDFAEKFEESITAVQVAEQTKVINEYEQQVQIVVQSIDVLNSDNQAVIANISASAEAEAKTLVAWARRDAFHLKQSMKATQYKLLQDALGFNGDQMAEYFKIKSLQAQAAAGSLVVGMPSVGHTGTGREEL